MADCLSISIFGYFVDVLKHLHCIDLRDLVVEAIWTKAFVQNLDNFLSLFEFAPVQRQ